MPSAIVVGGGLSGLSAAHTLIQNGCTVTMLDKNPFLGGNSTKATSGINGAGTRTQGIQGVEDSVEVFLEDIVRSATGVKTGPMPEPYPLARVIAGDSPHAVHWIQDSFGVALDVVSRMGGHSNQRCHRTKAGGKFPGMEITSALMKKFEVMADAEDGTADLIINAQVRSLIKDSVGRVVGVEYLDADGEIQQAVADAVVLATGGYGAGGAVDGSLLHKIRPDLVHLPTTNGDHSVGEGISMALDIGAKAIGLQHVQVHPTGLVNPSDPDNRTKFLAAEALRGEGGIILDNEGHRFCNDIGKRDYVTGRMWEHKKGPYRLILNSKSSGNMAWHCKHYCSRRVMKHMGTGADLANEMGISVNTLKAEFDKYNMYAKNYETGTGEQDPFGKIYFTNAPFDIHDNFYVAQVTPVVHYTMGGLAISTKSECVYDGSNRVIPGLYAAGELTGGVHGRNRLGGSGLLECVVFGRVAGANAANYIKEPKPPVSMTGGQAGTTTTISIPQNNGADPITITYSSQGGVASAAEVVGEEIDILDWDEAATTQVGGLTAAADGNEGAGAAKASAAPDTTGADVAVVYGSFFMGDSESDAKTIVNNFPSCDLDAPAQPFTGNDFNFNSLKNTKYLVVCTSSMYGNPPKNFWEFYYHLKVASENPNKPLKGLQHCVYGNGDETYFDTYMNVPRMIDNLLEKAGSRRFFARGETGEPHIAVPNKGEIGSEDWIPKMLECLATCPNEDDAPVEWGALWTEDAGPQHHTKTTDWELNKLEKKFGKPVEMTIFATLSASL